MAGRLVKDIEAGLFSIRWMLLPLYVGLTVVLGVYIFHFTYEVWDIIINFWEYYRVENALMLKLLNMVDTTMIAQLAVMMTMGGYAIFIRAFSYGTDELPQWLKHGFNTSGQKIKMGMSIEGVMVVHLLTDFIHGNTTYHDLIIKLALLGGVIFTTLSFALFNLLMHHPILDDRKEHH